MNKQSRQIITSSSTRTTRRSFLRGGGAAGLGLIAMTALSGCGQKGPLYLPGEDTKKKKKQG